MNRILKRPMFRMGGSSGTGITSGLDRPGYLKGGGADRMRSDAEKEERAYNLMRDSFEREQFLKERKRQMEMDKKRLEEKRRGIAVADGGRIGYANGSPNFMAGGFPGFLTGFGLNLLATPPQGNILATAGKAAQDPFARLQASQAAAMKTASDRAFARELSEEEREFEREQLEKRLNVEREKIAKMGVGDTTERVQAIADTKYDGDTIKAQREVDFGTKTYPNLVSEFGEESVATSVIDTSGLQKQKDIDRFVKQNPQLARQVVYDVRTGKAIKFSLDTVTNKYTIVPASPVDIEDTGDIQPAPRENPGLFGQPTKPGKPLKEILPDFTDPGFDEEFYQ